MERPQFSVLFFVLVLLNSSVKTSSFVVFTTWKSVITITTVLNRNRTVHENEDKLGRVKKLELNGVVLGRLGLGLGLSGS